MTTFLGVPVRVGAKVFGNLYVTDKLDGREFTEDDELVALTLGAQAAVAIGNAQRYGEQEQVALQASREWEHARAQGFRRAIEAQETERARIARELHDEAGQELTALALQLRAMDDHVIGEEGRAHLAAARHALARTSANLRALAIELRPSGLKDHGLASAIERQAARVQESSGIAIDLVVASIPGNLGDAVEIALFRVVQEALTNVARHSDAQHVSVVASAKGGRLRLVIEDDGKGFDPEAPTDRLGLAGIRERIQLIGGGLRIESAPQAGTTVIVELEISNE
jgi:signal transduction histidine kinase